MRVVREIKDLIVMVNAQVCKHEGAIDFMFHNPTGCYAMS